METKITIPAFLILWTCLTPYAQKADRTRRMYCAFGVRANTFLPGDFNQSLIPPARLQVKIAPIPYMRFELQNGISISDPKQ